MLKLPLAGVLPFLLVLSACNGKDPYNPGTPVGTFNVTGKLLSNSCGAAGSAPDPWTFSVKLSRDASTLYWIQGDVPVSGILDAQTHAKLTASATSMVRAADARHGISQCAIARADTVDATLAPVSSTGTIDTFTGSISYTFGATSDSDCSDQVQSGGYDALPCTVAYDLSAARDPNAKK